MNVASWYAVKKVEDDKAEIALYDEIGLYGITAKQFANELKGLGNRRVMLRIHSPGGEIFEGNAVYNALRRHPGGVDVAIDGLAASMASVIAMVGEKRSMAENGMLMIHNPWTFAFGDAEEMRKSADLLDTLKQTIISAYAGRTGMERKKLSGMMNDESWLTAAEALEYGFVTEITEPLQAYNSFERFDISKFAKRPSNFMSKLFPDKPEAKPEEIYTVAEIPETPENKVAEIPDFNAYLIQIDALTSRIEEMGKKHDEEIKAFQAMLSEGEQKFAKANESLGRLERAKGVAAAQVIANVPAVGAAKSPFEIWSEMPSNTAAEAEAKGTYYRKHQADILPFANKPALA